MVADQQPELVAVPAPSREHPGRCRLPTRYGAEQPCRNAAEGIVADWTAPLDPAQRLGACQQCAAAYGLELRPF